MKSISISLMLVLGLVASAAGCGSGSGESTSGTPRTNVERHNEDGHKLQAGDVRPALRSLPFASHVRRIKGPKGNVASFVGRAFGPHQITVQFSIGIGDPPMVIAIPGVGTRNVAWEEASGFVYNDNAWPTEFETPGEWQHAAHMSVELWESLCKAATGEPCPV